MIPNGSTVQYRKTRGKGVVRFHECPPERGCTREQSTHLYLVHFYTGPYAGESKQVWLRDIDVREDERRPAETVVREWDFDALALRGSKVAVTSLARVVLDHFPAPLALADPAAVAELQQVLDQAATLSARMARQLYPSELRMAVARALAAGARSMGDIHAQLAAQAGSQTSGWDGVQIHSELRAMAADGLAQPVLTSDAAGTYQLTAAGRKLVQP